MNRLREIREIKGFSQADLAAAAGVGQSDISRIERTGNTPRKKGMRTKLAAALKVRAGRLFPDDVGAPAGEPLPPKRVLFKSSEYADYRPETSAAPAPQEPIPMTRAICGWCGMQYNVANEVKILVGENKIKSYGHLSCLEQDVRTDGLELKKRGVPR
jgi:transcriptional regulator with XRE-family HTH domain